jgi:hypothetical protein
MINDKIMRMELKGFAENIRVVILNPFTPGALAQQYNFGLKPLGE